MAGGGERKTLNTGQGLDYIFSLSMLLFSYRDSISMLWIKIHISLPSALLAWFLFSKSLRVCVCVCARVCLSAFLSACLCTHPHRYIFKLVHGPV